MSANATLPSHPTGLSSKEDLEKWMRDHRVEEVECMIADMSGMARGKIMPAQKFANTSMRLPESIFAHTISGEWVYPEGIIDQADRDMLLEPDASSARLIPWAKDLSMQIIHDCHYDDGREVSIAPRQVLKKVLRLYSEKGWRPQIAPEIEFYLTKINKDPDYPLEPPFGRTGRQEAGRQAYSIDALNQFEDYLNDLYDYCEVSAIQIDTVSHEQGAAQLEFNVRHGDALDLADQVFLFKRTAREAALKHQMYATFLAKPMEGEPGSSMHLHTSLLDEKSGKNLFACEGDKIGPMLRNYIGGLQAHLPAAFALLAPNVNSYRRIVPDTSAPINTDWGYDNRTVGLRMPKSDNPESSRVENRLAGADANPYLAIAASLACGYLGLKKQLEPRGQVTTSTPANTPITLPRTLAGALEELAADQELRSILGEAFCQIYAAVKEEEYNTFFNVISSWEREFLMLNV